MINGQMCRGELLEESAGSEITFLVASGQGKPQGIGEWDTDLSELESERGRRDSLGAGQDGSQVTPAGEGQWVAVLSPALLQRLSEPGLWPAKPLHALHCPSQPLLPSDL